uniref:Putative acetyl-coa acetyltransferase n=1 Tax=Ixodes ricinus TaxID=34613 RepID=A0A0K8RBN1_IXORI
MGYSFACNLVDGLPANCRRPPISSGPSTPSQKSQGGLAGNDSQLCRVKSFSLPPTGPKRGAFCTDNVDSSQQRCHVESAYERSSGVSSGSIGEVVASFFNVAVQLFAVPPITAPLHVSKKATTRRKRRNY